MGFENTDSVAPGLGFGAKKGNPLIKQMCEMYQKRSFFKEDGTLNLTPSPVYTTDYLKTCGLVTDGSRQKIQDIDIFPAEYFAPLSFLDNRLNITENTYSIHWYEASWLTPGQKKRVRRIQRINRMLGTHMAELAYTGLHDIKEAGRRLLGRKK